MVVIFLHFSAYDGSALSNGIVGRIAYSGDTSDCVNIPVAEWGPIQKLVVVLREIVTLVCHWQWIVIKHDIDFNFSYQQCEDVGSVRLTILLAHLIVNSKILCE